MVTKINGSTGIDRIQDGVVQSADIASGVDITAGQITFGDGSIQNSYPASGFKNKIIGGDFTTNPWQRGTSFTAPVVGSFSADRWRIAHDTDGVVNILKTADAPTAVEAGIYTAHCLHVDVTTADTSIAAGQYWHIIQPVEGLNAASFGFGQAGARYVTLSFWHKHTKTGTYCAALRNSAGNRSYVAEYTQAVSDTWEKATITIPVDTTGTWLYDTGAGVNVGFALAAGTTYQTSANTWVAGLYLATANQVNVLDNVANNFKIALVQLEAGSVATPFESRSVGQELALCQRYYYRFTGAAAEMCGVGFARATTAAWINTYFPVPMRATPTALEQSGTASDYKVNYLATGVNCSSAPEFLLASKLMASSTFTTTAVLTAGNGVTAAVNNTSAYLGWSAEL